MAEATLIKLLSGAGMDTAISAVASASVAVADVERLELLAKSVFVGGGLGGGEEEEGEAEEGEAALFFLDTTGSGVPALETVE